MEQLLISTAVDEVLAMIDFSSLAGKRVFVDDQYLDCVDKKYIVASVRYQVLLAGGKLRDKKEDADVVLELRSGAVGTDRQDVLIGFNKVPLPAPQQWTLPVALPDAPLITRTAQEGVAKIGLVAYDPKTGELLSDVGMRLARSDHQQWIVLGIGPIERGSVHKATRKLEGSNSFLARFGLFDSSPPSHEAHEQEASHAAPLAELEATIEPVTPVRPGQDASGPVQQTGTMDR